MQQTDWVSHVAFSPDGARLASTSYLLNPEVYLWDLGAGALLQKFKRRNQGAQELAFTPDGRLLIARSSVNPYHDKQALALQVFDLSGNAAPFELGRKSVGYSALALSPDGKVLAVLIDRVGPHATGVELWDLASRALLNTFSMDPYDSVDGLRFSPDGAVLLGYAHRRMYIWELTTKTPKKKKFPAAPEVVNTIFSHGGTRCLTYINAFPGKSHEREQEFNKLRVYDTEEYKLLWSLDGLNKRELRYADFSPDGKLLALSCHATPLVRQHDDTRYPADVGYEVKIFDLATGSEIFRLPGSSTGTTAVALPKRANEEVKLSFSPDGRSLALYGWDKSFWILPIA